MFALMVGDTTAPAASPNVIMSRTSETSHPNRAAFPPGVSGPALRALSASGIRSVADLSGWSEKQLAALHGMGPKALAVLKDALATTGRRFRDG
jgi:hypothetical protein